MKDTFKGIFSGKKDTKEQEVPNDSVLTEAFDRYKMRRSIRKYSSQEIDEKTLYNILEASANAPCAGNIQNYDVIIIKDHEAKCQIGKIALQQSWIAEAPVVLVITRDDHTVKQLYPRDGDRYSIQNVASFINNILTFAHFSGLGACWVEACENGVLKDYLDIPVERKIDAIIPIGLALEKPEQTKESLSRKIYFSKHGNFKK